MRPTIFNLPLKKVSITIATSLGLVLLGGGLTVANAHSFNTLMVLPDTVTATGGFQQAFLLASEERDSHANEESNGHLGGLDVYITFATASDTSMIASAAPDVVAAPLGNAGGAIIADTSGAAFLPAPDPAAPASLELLARPAAPSLPPFAERFQTVSGRAPSEAEKAVYISARRIGQAVRTLGSAQDRNSLQDLFAR